MITTNLVSTADTKVCRPGRIGYKYLRPGPLNIAIPGMNNICFFNLLSANCFPEQIRYCHDKYPHPEIGPGRFDRFQLQHCRCTTIRRGQLVHLFRQPVHQ